jgi:two-component system chemotaxis response regulator CheY
VDDSSFARNRLRIIFDRAGHTVVGSAANGEQAMRLFETLQPDVVTLDYLMTGKDGEEVLREIIDYDPKARVIMVSGSGNHVVENRVLAAGAKLFIEKSNSQGQFLNAIDEVMKA